MPTRVFLDFFSNVLSLLPYRVYQTLACLFAVLMFDIFRIRRRLVLRNIETALGNTVSEREKISIGRKSIANFILTSFEFLTSRKSFPRTRVDVHNDEILSNALAQGKGVYNLCIHMGNWELMCHIGSKYFAPVHVVVKPIGKGKVAEWVNNLRRSNGMHVVEREGRMAVTQLFRALKKKEIVGMIADQSRPGSPRIPFFGKPALTNVSLFTLWQRHEAPIVPCFMRRIGPYHHELTFIPELEVVRDPTKSVEELAIINSARMNKVIEEMILQNPSEYFWLHNRWK